MERAQIRNEQAQESNARKQGARFLKTFERKVTSFPQLPEGSIKRE